MPSPPLPGTERGQIMTFVALLSLVLIGTVSLAVDVGQLYAARRVLQNAADAAALVAVSKMPDQTAAASAAAASIGANAAGATHQVNFPPSISVAPAAGGSYSGEVVEVIVTANVPHLYAVIFGRSSSPVSARAIAGKQPAITNAAIVALDAGNDYAIETSGSGGGLVSNGGVFSNGGICASGASSLQVLSPGTVGSVEGVQTGAPCVESSVMGNETQSAQPIGDPFAHIAPPPGAPTSPTQNAPSPPGWLTLSDTPDADGWVRVYPGWYQNLDLKNNRDYKFLSGVYFVRGNVDLTARKVVGVKDWAENPNDAFDLDAPSDEHPWGPVTFYLYGGASQEVTLNASAQIKLAARKNVTNYESILLWMVNGSNHNAGISFNGGGNTRLFGSIYAPQAHVEVSGNYGGGSFLEGQMIVNTVTVTGSSQTHVNYNSNYAPPARPYAVLIR